MPVDLGENSDAGTGLGDPGGADEDGGERPLLAVDRDRRLEARDLAPERVSLDDEIDQAEPLAVEHDHPGTGSEDGCRERPDRVVEAVEAHQPHHRRRLATRDDEAVEPLELLRQAHLDRLDAEAMQHRDVLAERALEGEDADLHRLIVVTAARAGALRCRLCGDGCRRVGDGAGRGRRGRRPTAAASRRDEDAEADEDRAEREVDERAAPLVDGFGLGLEERHQRAEGEPLLDEIGRRAGEPERAEDGIARAAQDARGGDVDEGDDQDEQPFPRLLVPEPEDRASDREAADDVEPERVRVRLAAVDRSRRRRRRRARRAARGWLSPCRRRRTGSRGDPSPRTRRPRR